MKMIIIGLFTVVLCLPLFGQVYGQDIEAVTKDGKVVVLSSNGTWAYKEETPTVTKVQQKSSTPNPEAESNDTGDWVMKYYVDKFQNETDQPYLTTSRLISGTFSNSATRNSTLLVKVLYDTNNGLAFEFYQYGTSPYSATFRTEYFSVSIEDGAGKQHEYRSGAVMSEGSFRVRLLPSYNKKKDKQAEEVLQYLLNGGTVKFLLVTNDRPNQTFLFDLNADGFSAAYKMVTEPKPTPSQITPTPKP